MMRLRFSSDHLTEKARSAFKCRAVDGLLGEFAAAVGAA
jgi:hypothetical protein